MVCCSQKESPCKRGLETTVITKISNKSRTTQHSSPKCIAFPTRPAALRIVLPPTDTLSYGCAPSFSCPIYTSLGSIQEILATSVSILDCFPCIRLLSLLYAFPSLLFMHLSSQLHLPKFSSTLFF